MINQPTGSTWTSFEACKIGACYFDALQSTVFYIDTSQCCRRSIYPKDAIQLRTEPAIHTKNNLAMAPPASLRYSGAVCARCSIRETSASLLLYSATSSNPLRPT